MRKKLTNYGACYLEARECIAHSSGLQQWRIYLCYLLPLLLFLHNRSAFHKRKIRRGSGQTQSRQRTGPPGGVLPVRCNLAHAATEPTNGRSKSTECPCGRQVATEFHSHGIFCQNRMVVCAFFLLEHFRLERSQFNVICNFPIDTSSLRENTVLRTTRC